MPTVTQQLAATALPSAEGWRQVAERGFAVNELSVNASPDADPVTGAPAGLALPPTVEVVLQVHGKGSVNDLASVLTEIPGVRAVIADDANAAA